MKIYFYFAFFFLTLVSPVYAATPPSLYVCISKSNGAINVRSKCKGTEIKASASTLGAYGIQGPQGPQGIPGPAGISEAFDISSCRSFGNSNFTTTGAASVVLSCTSSEFLLNYGIYTDPAVSLDFIRFSKITYDGKVPNGIHVLVQTQTGTPDPFNIYTLYVTTTCCPR